MENPPHLRIVLSKRNHITFLPVFLQGPVSTTYTGFEFHIAKDGPTDPIYEAYLA